MRFPSFLPAALYLALLAFLGMPYRSNAAVMVIGRAGIALPSLPEGMQVVLDTPDQLLINGEEVACGWRVGDLKKNATTSVEIRIRVMTGVASAALLRKGGAVRLRGGHFIYEMAADSVSDKGTFLRRIVVAEKDFDKDGRTITGYCIAPGMKYELLREKLIGIASRALLLPPTARD